MPYLTYIIENYHNLPSIMAFIHSHEDGYPRAWHNDAPNYSNVASLQKLRLDYVQSNGYVNLRCNHVPGCPAELQPFRDPPEKDNPDRQTENLLPGVWDSLFPGVELPHVIGVPCCAQFAVSGDRARERPLEDYVRIRDWLVETDLSSDVSGRVLEYMWHIIFGMEPVYCPIYGECRCNVYGEC